MKLSNLNESLTLLANLGVILGIIFIVIEIQQNTNMMRSQTRDSMTDKQLSFYAFTGSSYENAKIIGNALSSNEVPEAGTPEWVLVTSFIQSNFRLWENEWYQYQQGLFQEDEFGPRMETWNSNADFFRLQDLLASFSDVICSRFSYCNGSIHA